MTRRHLIVVPLFAAIVLSLTICRTILAAEIVLTWNSSFQARGYKVYYGLESGNYSHMVDIGNWTECSISELEEDRHYYFAVTAYNDFAESDFSEELVVSTSRCEDDANGDGDTDGVDLAAMVNGSTTAIDPESFAAQFGKTACPGAGIE